jgi:hypothetical protein
LFRHRADRSMLLILRVAADGMVDEARCGLVRDASTRARLRRCEAFFA